MSKFGEIFGVGFSAMLMQVMTLVQQTVLYNVASQHGGESWQIILGAALRVQSFAFIPLWGMSQGFQPAAGTKFGAKQYDQVGSTKEIKLETGKIERKIQELEQRIITEWLLTSGYEYAACSAADFYSTPMPFSRHHHK